MARHCTYLCDTASQTLEWTPFSTSPDLTPPQFLQAENHQLNLGYTLWEEVNKEWINFLRKEPVEISVFSLLLVE